MDTAMDTPDGSLGAILAAASAAADVAAAAAAASAPEPRSPTRGATASAAGNTVASPASAAEGEDTKGASKPLRADLDVDPYMFLTGAKTFMESAPPVPTGTAAGSRRTPRAAAGLPCAATLARSSRACAAQGSSSQAAASPTKGPATHRGSSTPSQSAPGVSAAVAQVWH